MLRKKKSLYLNEDDGVNANADPDAEIPMPRFIIGHKQS